MNLDISYKKLIFYGVLLWVLTFAGSFLIYPLHESNRILFESMIPVFLTFNTVLCFSLYIRNKTEIDYKNGLIIGLLWLLLSILIDLSLFLSPSPMHVNFIDYMYDIGITYLIIPVITVAMSINLPMSK